MRILIGFFFKALAFLVSALPRRVRLFMGDVVGFLWFDVLRIRRKVAVDNVRLAYPSMNEEEATRIARASLHSMGRSLVEYCMFPFLTHTKVEKTFRIHGREIVDKAFQEGKGAIFLTLHLGNGDYSIAALSALGIRVHLISKEFNLQWLNDLWFGMRRKRGTKFISPEKSSFEILRALKNNDAVIFVLDQFMGPPIGVRTRFFGVETGTAMGCALIADRT